MNLRSVVGCLLMVGCAAMPCVAQGSGASYPTFVVDAEVPLGVGGGLSMPRGVAVAVGGDTYVVDAGNLRVVKIAAATGATTAVPFGAFGPPLADPTGLAIDGGGNLYVADRGTNRIIKLPVGGGHAITVISGAVLDRPVSVAADSVGNLAVASEGLTTITTRRYGGAPFAFNTGTTVLVAPKAVAYDQAGSLYVADGGNGTTGAAVYRFPARGGTGTTLTPAGYTLGSVTGLAVDAQGNVFVEDAAEGQLIEVPVGGGAAYLLPHSTESAPSGLAVDSLGNVYVADSGATANSVTELVYGNAANFGSLPVGTPGKTLRFNFAFYQPTTVEAAKGIGGDLQLEAGGTCRQISYYPAPSGAGAPVPATCSVNFRFKPTLVGGRPGAVELVTSSGTAAQLATGVGLGGLLGLYNSAISLKLNDYYVQAMVINTAGSAMYFSDGGATYRAPLPVGTPVQLTMVGGLLALDGAENLYVLQGTTVTEVPADGSATRVVATPGLVNPQSIVADPNGAIYISDRGPGDPESDYYTPAGFVLRVSAHGAVSKLLPPYFYAPSFLATNGDGSIYIENDRQIDQVNVGSGSLQVSEIGPTIGGLNGAIPTNLAVDASGTAYFYDTSDFSQLFVYAPPLPEGSPFQVDYEFQLPLYTLTGFLYYPDSPYLPFQVATGNQAIALAPNGKMYVANGGGKGVYLVDRTLGSVLPQAFEPGFQYIGGNPQTASVYNIGNQTVTFASAGPPFSESGDGVGSFTFGAPLAGYNYPSCGAGAVIAPSEFCAIGVTDTGAVGMGPVVTDFLHFFTDAVNDGTVTFRIRGYGAAAAK